MSSYLDPSGKAFTESKDYIKYICEKSFTEKVVSVEVTDYEKTDDGYVVKMGQQKDKNSNLLIK